MARILVIDDDRLVRETVGAMLAAGGHETVLARGSADGVGHFRDQPFDLVICDLFMPTMERGFEAIGALRAISATTPTISMTGGAPIADGNNLGAEPPLELRPLHLIVKPFRMQELLAIVRKCLGAATVSLATLQTMWI
jgi:CheY-like chemotaxis protein